MIQTDYRNEGTALEQWIPAFAGMAVVLGATFAYEKGARLCAPTIRLSREAHNVYFQGNDGR